MSGDTDTERNRGLRAWPAVEALRRASVYRDEPPRRARPGRKGEKSEQTLAAIVDAATEIALAHGVFNITLGQVAKRLQVSKSGVSLRAGSLEALQLRVVESYAADFRREVIGPAMHEPAGLPRLDALVRRWIARGSGMKAMIGAHQAIAEPHPDKPQDPLRDRLVAVMENWRRLLVWAAQAAIDAGHLRADADAEQIAFELGGLMAGTVAEARIRQRPDAQQRMLTAYERLLRDLRAPAS